MFPARMFPVRMFAPRMFPPGVSAEERKRGAGAIRRPIIHFIHRNIEERKKETVFSSAFKNAVQQQKRKKGELRLSNEIVTGRLQDVGDIAKLNDNDLAMILLLLD